MIYLYLAISTLIYAGMYYYMMEILSNKLNEQSYFALFSLVVFNIAMPFITFYIFFKFIL